MRKTREKRANHTNVEDKTQSKKTIMTQEGARVKIKINKRRKPVSRGRERGERMDTLAYQRKLRYM